MISPETNIATGSSYEKNQLFPFELITQLYICLLISYWNFLMVFLKLVFDNDI